MCCDAQRISSAADLTARSGDKAVGLNAGLGVLLERTSNILRPKACVLGNPSKHARTDLLAVVEGKDEVRPAVARKRAVRP